MGEILITGVILIDSYLYFAAYGAFGVKIMLFQIAWTMFYTILLIIIKIKIGRLMRANLDSAELYSVLKHENASVNTIFCFAFLPGVVLDMILLLISLLPKLSRRYPHNVYEKFARYARQNGQPIGNIINDRNKCD